jgi:hypothetical protein
MMLELAWAELAEVSRRIDQLKAQRSMARTVQNAGRVRVLADELDRAISEREHQVARITAIIGGGGLEGRDALYRLAA